MTRLFIPGPTDVNPETLEAMQQPMIGHRSQEFIDLFARIQANLKQVFQSPARVFVTASSGSGLFEGAMRNCVAQRVLVCECGIFGQRWYAAAQRNGLPCDIISSEWGLPNLPDQIAAAMEKNSYDVLIIVHNETSTGIENPIAEIAARARAMQPDLVIMIDAVSSAGGVELKPVEWDLDVVITSSQKCFALPPGLAFACVSERAMQRARTIEQRGWYFDFLLLEEFLQRDLTPATPSISLLFALDHQLKRILDEGLEARIARHEQMATLVHDWGKERFELFAAEGYRSKTVTTIRNTREIDVPKLNTYLAGHDMVLADGYGPLKGITFRIGHMGETRTQDVQMLLDHIDKFLDSDA